MTGRGLALIAAVAFAVSGCADPTAAGTPTLTAATLATDTAAPTPTQPPTAAPAATPVPIAFIVTSPTTGARIDSMPLTVTGTAPAGSRIVRDVAFGFDDETTADASGAWHLQVSLGSEGVETLVFRVGDDAATAIRVEVRYFRAPSERWVAAACPGMAALDDFTVQLPLLRTALLAKDQSAARRIAKRILPPAQTAYTDISVVGWSVAGPFERALWSAGGSTIVAAHRAVRAFDESSAAIRHQAVLDTDDAISKVAAAVKERDGLLATTGFACP